MSTSDILVTGFGPFPGVAHNLSGWLVQMLARTQDANVMAAVLPVCWQGAWGALAPLLEECRPRCTILFGVSREARGFQLEQCAYNAASGRPDTNGQTAPDGKLTALGAPMRNASLPLSDIAAALTEARLSVTLSDDPGRYLCNATLYRALEWAEGATGSRVGFVHIPPYCASGGAEPTGLSADDLLTGARLIVDTAMRGALPARDTA